MQEGVGQEAELSVEIIKHLRGVGVRALWCCGAQGPGPSACEPHRERDPRGTCIPCRDAPCSPCSSLAALGSAQCLQRGEIMAWGSPQCSWAHGETVTGGTGS